MKRISKRVREEAALICAISASWPADRADHLYTSIGNLIGACNESVSLAADALMAAPVVYLSRRRAKAAKQKRRKR